MNYFTDFAKFDFLLIVDVLGDPITRSLPLTNENTGLPGILGSAISGSLNQADTEINLYALDPALAVEQVKLHGTEWYVAPALMAEANIASGAASIALPVLAQGDQIGFFSPLYSLTETASSIEITPGVSSVNAIVVPASIASVTIDRSTPVLSANGTPVNAPVTLDLSGAQNVSITGWTGGDHLALVEAAQGYSAAIAINPSAHIGPLSPAAMHLAVVVDVGNVGADTAAAVASAADAVYSASTSGTDSHGLFFEAQTGGNTTIFAFSGDAHGVVSAADLTHVTTLVGVHSIGTADLAIG